MKTKSYALFENEEDYMKAYESSVHSPKDKALRRRAIRTYKEIYGSSLRKLFEVTGWHSGEFLDCDIIQEEFEDCGLHEETYKFVKCLIEAYNDNAEYKKRKTPMRKWKSYNVRKRHFKKYLSLGTKELKKYRNLFTKREEQERFQAMRMGLLIYNTILRIFFLRKPPKHIPMDLYTSCVKVDPDFEKYYEKGADGARLTMLGKRCRARKCGGFRNTFKDEVTWLFVMYFLRFDY